jgi:hypothetical protein
VLEARPGDRLRLRVMNVDGTPVSASPSAATG